MGEPISPVPAQPTEDLDSLMAQYQNGDHDAATALIERLSPQLHRFFLAQVASWRYADDLLQETWLRIHSARHTYRPGEPVLPWIYAIARHVKVDSYRKVHRTEIREQQVDVLPDVAVPPSSQQGPDLESLLRILPDSQREVVVMLKVSEMSLEQVAQATSSTVGSVKQKAHRAYEKLRQALLEMGFGRTAGGIS